MYSATQQFHPAVVAEHVAGVNIAPERVESIMAAVFGVLGLATCLG
jgi:hypothetical protein